MFLDLDPLAEAALPPLHNLLRLAEVALDGARQITHASLDATRQMAAAGGASLLLADAWRIWPADALALQAHRREQALEKAAGHYRRLLGVTADCTCQAGSLAETATRSGAVLTALQSVWLDTASAFGSLQYCPVMRRTTVS